MADYQILEFDDFNPRTVVVNFFLDGQINVYNLAEYIPVHNVFVDGKRLKVEKISYYGEENVVVNVGYCRIKRGVKKNSMNNMVSLDFQTDGKNCHFKISKNKITSIGESSIENSIKYTEILLKLINDTQKEINMTEKSEIFLEKYRTDYDDEEQYTKKIDKIKNTNIDILSEVLSYSDYGCYNSVYHIKQDTEINITSHKLACFLSEQGLEVNFDNRSSASLSITIDVKEEKEKKNAIYKHRININNHNLKQTSPSSREEAYESYLLVSNLIKKFLDR